MILSQSERIRIVKSCHEHSTSGHLGMKRTLSRITDRYMWPGVSKDVYSLVKIM